MAKQRVNTDLPQSGTGIVSSAAAVSASRDKKIGEFAKTAGTEARKAFDNIEARVKAIKTKANELAAGFDGSYNVADFTTDQQNAVKGAVTTLRNDYIEQSNIAAKYSATDPRYSEAIDKMNAIEKKMQKLRSNLEGFAKYKIEYQENSKEDNYSGASQNENRLAQGLHIMDNATFTIDENGDLKFDAWQDENDNKYEGFTYSVDNYEKPYEKVAGKEALGKINVLLNQIRVSPGVMDEFEEDIIRDNFEQILKDPAVVYDMYSRSELKLLDFTSLQPESDDVDALRKAMIDKMIDVAKEQRGIKANELGIKQSQQIESLTDIFDNKTTNRAVKLRSGTTNYTIVYNPSYKEGGNSSSENSPLVVTNSSGEFIGAYPSVDELIKDLQIN